MTAEEWTILGAGLCVLGVLLIGVQLWLWRAKQRFLSWRD